MSIQSKMWGLEGHPRNLDLNKRLLKETADNGEEVEEKQKPKAEEARLRFWPIARMW